MSRSWCLAIALLVSSSMATAAAVSDSDAVTPTSRHVKAATHVDGFLRVAAKTCTPDSYQRTECIEGFKGQCQTNANQTAKCAKRIASGCQLTTRPTRRSGAA